MHPKACFPILVACVVAWAAPDEERLGKSKGYPVGTASTWFFDESVRVGSFTALADTPGIAGGSVHELAPSSNPLPLPRAAAEPPYRWELGAEQCLVIDDILSRQRIMGLLIIKDGVIQVERYQYARGPGHRFVSHSMAKSIVSLAIGMALREGKLRYLDDRAAAYAPKLVGTLLGETTLRALLRMASGARYTEE
ncbi:MAG: serine hydrolase [Spirochaetes bacterium]|nr:serine hydrolase [Spirochaetota bacterium]